MQRSSSDWADPEGEEEAGEPGAVAVSVGSDIRGGAAGWVLGNEVKNDYVQGQSRRRGISSEASSYVRAAQGEPLGCFVHLAGHETVSRELPFQSDFRVRLVEELDQSLDTFRGNYGIHATRRDEHS